MFLRSYEGKTRKWPAIVIGLAVAAVVAAPAKAEADVINGKSAKCSTGHRFPAVYKIRTARVPAHTGSYRIPRWLVACSGANWLQSHWEMFGRMPRTLVLHGASWNAGTWKVRYRVVHKRWDEGTYAHIVLSKGSQRLIFNGYS